MQALPGLSPRTRDFYVNQIAGLSNWLANGATTIELTGLAVGINGKTMNFQKAYPIASMQADARKVGAMIATAQLIALGGHSIQDIETWDDADENAAVKIAGRMQANFPVVSGGDDAQLLAGLTPAAIPQPSKNGAFPKMTQHLPGKSFAKATILWP